MQISIAERLRPFSHLPGTSTILPGSHFQIQIFPTLIRIYHLKSPFPRLALEVGLSLRGPIEQFTITNDLEKGIIIVKGKSEKGWFSYYLESDVPEENIYFFVEKSPLDGLALHEGKNEYLLGDKQGIALLKKETFFEAYHPEKMERLSLGNSKAQNWEWIKNRLNFAEIFPLWHRIGQMIPKTDRSNSHEGTLALLEECKLVFDTERPEQAEQKWKNLFLAGFKNLLVPRLEDEDHQGIIPYKPLDHLDVSPLILLSEGGKLIRSLFIQQEKEKIAILPFLLPSFHCGRLINYSLPGGGWLSMEWSKKTIRRMIISSEQEGELNLLFRPHVKCYRLRNSLNAKGEIKKSTDSLNLLKNHYYYLDNFA